MSPNLRQRITRHKGEGYVLSVVVDLEDPDANAAGVSEVKLDVGGVAFTGSAADTGTAGVVELSFTVAPGSFSELLPGPYFWESSLKLGGDPVVVAGGVFTLLSSQTLEVSS